jgi:hypothetical protein
MAIPFIWSVVFLFLPPDARLHRELRELGATHLLLSKIPGAVRAPENSEWKR